MDHQGVQTEAEDPDLSFNPLDAVVEELLTEKAALLEEVVHLRGKRTQEQSSEHSFEENALPPKVPRPGAADTPPLCSGCCCAALQLLVNDC